MKIQAIKIMCKVPKTKFAVNNIQLNMSQKGSRK